jgi:hypothetical protein
MENIYGRVEAVEQEIEVLAPIKALLNGKSNHGLLPYRKLNTEVCRAIDLLDGNEERGVPSLRDQLSETMKLLKQVLDERATAKAQMRGIVIGLGITGLTSISTLVAVLKGAFGG